MSVLNAQSGFARQLRRARSASSLTARSLEQTNPLRGLTLAKAVSLMEAVLRGEYADPQWTLWHVEQSDPDLIALEARRSSALMEMDWTIKIADLSSRIEGKPAQARAAADDVLATEQADALLEAYNALGNLNECIEDMALAFVRGYSIAQKEPDALRPTTLGVYDPWNVLRDGLKGAFYFNPEARQTSARTLGDEFRMDPATHLIYTPRAPLMRIALYKFIRQNLSQKDWDAFIEIYGIPSAYIIGPPNVPPEKEAEYRDAAEDVADGGSGYMPNGSDVKFPSEIRGVSPFAAHLEYLQKQLILAGTGGLLTMLSMPTGIGAGAAPEHDETFRIIARGEAKRISEVFQKQFDAPLLAGKFPKKPVLAYWELCYREEQDIGKVVEHAVALSQAGYAMDPAELSEKTGYKLFLKPPSADVGLPGFLPHTGRTPPSRAGSLEIRNRTQPASASPSTDPAPDPAAAQSPAAQAVSRTLGLRAEWLGPIFEQLERLAGNSKLGDAELLAELERLAKTIPGLLDERAIEQTADALQGALLEGVADGLESSRRKEIQAA